MMIKLSRKVLTFLKAEDGPTTVEYAIMLAVLMAIHFLVVQSIGTGSNTIFNNVSNSIDQGNQGR